MSERIIIEVETRPEEWTRIGSVAPDEPPGTIANQTTPGQRDAYVFGWHDGQGPCLWRSETGVDTVVVVDHTLSRVTTNTGLDVLAHLDDTGTHTVPITGRDGTANIRFRYQRS